MNPNGAETFDVVGKGTLEAFSEAPAFNAWMYEKVAGDVGKVVLEVGSGIGNLTGHIVAQRIFATDMSDEYLGILRTRFSVDPRVSVHRFDVAEQPPAELHDEEIDTVLCMNVLEHISRERRALDNLFRILVPGGTLILLVPYAAWLYNPLDEELGHVRRYNHRTVCRAVETAGFRVARSFVFNFFGGVGWFVRGTLLRRRTLSAGSIGLFGTLTPIFRRLESFGTVFGSSIICVAKKPGG